MQQDGYTNSTINTHMSAANGLLRYLRRSVIWQLICWTKTWLLRRGYPHRVSAPLQTARLVNNSKVYLLTNIDIQLRDLATVTVENVSPVFAVTCSITTRVNNDSFGNFDSGGFVIHNHHLPTIKIHQYVLVGRFYRCCLGLLPLFLGKWF